jgi:multidrug efflux pump
LTLPEICIRKPVLAIVLSLLLVVLGVIGYLKLEILFFPRLQIPVVHVSTHFDGASAGLMESKVTTPIENSLAGIENVQYITSSSGSENSSITVQFNLDGDLEREIAEVRDKVSAIKKDLPADVNSPSVSKSTSGGAIVGMTFVDKDMKLQDFRDYLERNVAPRFKQIKGVAGVGVYGSTDYAMRVWLDPTKMAARDITVGDIKSAISANNIKFPSGSFRSIDKNYPIVSDTRLKSAKQFRNIIIKSDSHAVVRLSDVATVKLGMRGFYDLPMHIGNQTGLAIQVSALSSANPIQVAKRVVHEFNLMKRNHEIIKPEMQAHLLYNNADFLQSSIDETFISILEAVVLVVLVVILFIGSLRASSVAIVTIPISLIAVFFVIKCLGFSINVMSLMAMVLAIGLVVDDAIVMMENIHRHIEAGESPMVAAVKGSREIAFPIVVMAITLVAVYAPVGLVQGYTSELFKEFAFTLASAVVISAFVALTLSPMMCSRVLLPHGQTGGWVDKVDFVFSKLSGAYQVMLKVMLKHRLWVLASLIVIGLVGFLIYSRLHSEFIPKEDYGRIDIGILAPPGEPTLNYTERYANQIIARLRKIPEIKQTMFQMNGGYIGISCYLKSWKHRHRTSEQVAAGINRWLEKVPGVDAIAVIPDVVSYGPGGRGVTINFTTTKDYKDLLPVVNRMKKMLQKYPGVQSPSAGLKFDTKEYVIHVNRDLAALLGVQITDLADTVQAMMSGIHWTDVQAGSRSYAVLLQMKKKDLLSDNPLGLIYIPSSNPVSGNGSSVLSANGNNMIPLTSLITLTSQGGQSSLQHYNRERSGSVSAAVAPGYTESQVIAYIDKHLPGVIKSSEVGVKYSGKAAQLKQSANSMGSILLLSFVFIYLVLSAQFGSFIDPFIILFAVPLSMVGALFSLWVSGGTISLYSQIGIVTLVGLISKHGILITKFINDLREQGVEFTQAILQGACIRLRPVLMTTLAMIFGTLPLVLSSGPGSIGRHQIGWTIIGGLFFGTFFSLVVVPIAYYYLGRFKRFSSLSELDDI